MTSFSKFCSNSDWNVCSSHLCIDTRHRDHFPIRVPGRVFIQQFLILRQFHHIYLESLIVIQIVNALHVSCAIGFRWYACLHFQTCCWIWKRKTKSFQSMLAEFEIKNKLKLRIKYNKMQNAAHEFIAFTIWALGDKSKFLCDSVICLIRKLKKIKLKWNVKDIFSATAPRIGLVDFVVRSYRLSYVRMFCKQMKWTGMKKGGNFYCSIISNTKKWSGSFTCQNTLTLWRM